jgi:uncharacterized protein (DUF362 family)
MKQSGKRVNINCNAAIAENADPSRTGDAIRRVVELTGGMEWLKPGQTVLINPTTLFNDL